MPPTVTRYFHVSLEVSLEQTCSHTFAIKYPTVINAASFIRVFTLAVLDSFLILVTTRYLVTQNLCTSLEVSVEESRKRALQSFRYQVLQVVGIRL